jgi:hydroxypyruvate reductase
MLLAAANFAKAHKVRPIILGDVLEGEARDVGKTLAGIARSVRAHGLPVEPPCLLLSGGETTVSITTTSPGRGGRNCELLHSAAIALEGETRI